MAMKGDATQEEGDEQLKKDLAGRIAASSDTNPVRLSTAEATRVLDLLGGPPEPEKEEEKDAKEKARAAGVAPQVAPGTPEGQGKDEDEEETHTRGPRGGKRR